jgi:signal transduction histidine kinase
VLSPLVFRITAPLVVVSLLLLGVGVGAAMYVNHMQQKVSRDVISNSRSLRAAEEVEILFWELRAQFDDFLISGDRSHLQVSDAFRRETDRWLGVAERYSLTPTEQRLTDQARRGYRRFLTEVDALPASLPTEDLKARVKTLVNEVIAREIVLPIHAYLDHNEVEVEESVTENQRLADRLVYGLLWLGICGCGAGLAAGFGIARGISRSLIQLNVPIRAAAGQLETLVGPLTFASGTDIGQMEGVLRSIADRIGAVVERVRQSEREVLRSEQLAAVGQMAAGMAHELRNPLTSMKLLVQAALAQDPQNVFGPPDGEAPGGLSERALRVLEEEISRMEGLVQSFLQFARPPKLERREADLKLLVGQAVRLVTVRAAQRDIRIESALPDGPVLFPVDSGQFGQVLLNLLLNALDAVPSGGLIRVALLRDPGGPVRLEVSDSGCGLPNELGGRIFAPFVTTKETGLGLGLSICKRIVEAHGGTISAANRPEGGAVFTLTIPGEPAA